MVSSQIINLNVTLPGRADWQALAGEVKGAMEEISGVIDSYAPSQNEAQTEEDLVRPVLRALGHDFEVQPALDTPEGTKRPDYVFYRDVSICRFMREAFEDGQPLAGHLEPLREWAGVQKVLAVRREILDDAERRPGSPA